uniref:Adipocyte plasma membrane-associated protein-like n=1 Tax=Phallusia mammillata TaxID=59560 RepID=A0A6F9D7A9_9ASCI|nr:adipocyte plasma membrane-associated protein-like [Phallusia mammillata]
MTLGVKRPSAYPSSKTVMPKPRQRNRRQQDSTQRPAEKLTKVQSKPVEKTQYSSRICGVLFVGLLALLGGVAGLGYYRSPITALAIADIAPVIEFERNTKLTDGEINKNFVGPESIEEDIKGNLYTGLSDGRIVRIEPSGDGRIGFGKSTTIAELKLQGKRNHGRPLGVRLLGDTLYVVDAYSGLYKLNVKTSKLSKLVGLEDASPPMKFPDDLSVTADERKIYFSDASAKYSIDELMPLALSGLCDSRILEYDTKTKSLKVVISGLCFANGVQLSSDEKQLIVTETLGHKVLFYDVATWKRTKLVRLPAMPDNIRPSSKGTYWIALTNPRDGMKIVMDKYPVLRQIIAGTFSSKQLEKVISPFCIVMEMDENGEILQTLQDPTSKLAIGISQVTELSDGRLALGTYIAPQLVFLNPRDSKPIGSKP